MMQPRPSQTNRSSEANASTLAFEQKAARNRIIHAVTGVLHDYENGWNELDPGKLMDLFSHDAMFIYGGLPLRANRQDMRRAVERMLNPDHEVRLEIDDIKMHGVIAYAKTSMRWYARGESGAKHLCEKRGLFVLRRRPEGWRIAHHILSRVLAVAE